MDAPDYLRLESNFPEDWSMVVRHAKFFQDDTEAKKRLKRKPVKKEQKAAKKSMEAEDCTAEISDEAHEKCEQKRLLKQNASPFRPYLYRTPAYRSLYGLYNDMLEFADDTNARAVPAECMLEEQNPEDCTMLMFVGLSTKERYPERMKAPLSPPPTLLEDGPELGPEDPPAPRLPSVKRLRWKQRLLQTPPQAQCVPDTMTVTVGSASVS